MGNPDNSTDISDSNHARRTALAEAAIVLEAPRRWKPSPSRPATPRCRGPEGPAAAWIYDPGRAELRVIADVLAFEASAS